MSELLQVIQEGGAAVSVIVAIVLFLKGLKDQRDSFQKMIEDQNQTLRAHADQLARNTEMLGRVSAHLSPSNEGHSGMLRVSP